MIDKSAILELSKNLEDAQYQDKVAFFWIAMPFLLLGAALLFTGNKISQALFK